LLARCLRKHDAVQTTKSSQILNFELRGGIKAGSVHSGETSTLAVDLMTILIGAVNLQSLTADGQHALTGLTISSRVSFTTMRYLRITVNKSEPDALSTLGYISYLSNLRELSVQLEVDPQRLEYFTLLLPWDLHHLQKLTIKSSVNQGLMLSKFLGQCNFPALVSISISSSFSAGPEDSTHLSFLFRKCKHIQRAYLDVPGVLPVVLLPHVSVPDLEFNPLTPAMTMSLSPTTHTLRIAASVAAVDHVQLWKMLISLQKNATGVRTVWIHGSSFSWMSGAACTHLDKLPSITTLLPRLLHHAAELSKRNIAIKDDNGKAAMDYFKGPQ
jgi:hypothetical protein